MEAATSCQADARLGLEGVDALKYAGNLVQEQFSESKNEIVSNIVNEVLRQSADNKKAFVGF